MSSYEKVNPIEAMEDTVVVEPINERSNDEIATVVNLGIAASVLVNVQEALKLMDEAGIPKEVSLRVLNSKARRRATDWR